MRWRKKTKTIEDISVEDLFDDFVHVHVEEDSKHVNDIDDDEYVSMMLKKDANRKLERLKRNPIPISTEHAVMQRKSEDLEASPQPEPERIKVPVERTMLPEGETLVEEIMRSQSIEDIPALTGRMKVAVEFVQWEMGSSISNKKRQKS